MELICTAEKGVEEGDPVSVPSSHVVDVKLVMTCFPRTRPGGVAQPGSLGAVWVQYVAPAARHTPPFGSF